MAFMLISHGVRHLQVASADGHRVRFNVVLDGGSRLVACGGVEWIAGRQPADSLLFLEEAARFASVCAQDYGLI